MTTTASTAQSFLNEANIAAKNIVTGWIQKTFQETSLQCLRQQLQQRVSDECDDLEMEVTTTMLEQCHFVCQRLAVHWEKRLYEANQNQVAMWVKEVAARGEFWEPGDCAQINVESSQQSETALSEVEDSELPESRNADEEETVLAVVDDFKLPLAKLRHLFSTCTDLHTILATLNALGKSGDTQWPFDWKIIEDYCREELVNRLHARSPRVTFEVVPKDLAQDEDDDVIQSKKLKALFKRKALDNTKLQEQRPNRRTRTENDEPCEGGRPASDQPEVVVWNWKAVKETIRDKVKLEAICVHSETEPDPPITILGALHSLGYPRFALSNPDVTVMTEKQRQRALATCVKQRLGSLLVVRDARKTPMTKVVRARSKEHHHMELDVTECLLELGGKLFAFSSIEVSLDDEDAHVHLLLGTEPSADAE
ncbi:hypothetical protein MHU86_3482 [Fragilaria crotonensis]|nr:hypothetical protein MHU86_3482 [Fragilaria crotonensis]